jgi:hypothetical protein
VNLLKDNDKGGAKKIKLQKLENSEGEGDSEELTDE